MSTDPTTEQRLAALETAVADLQRRLGNGAPAANWWERVVGSIKDEAAFAEALEYGRIFRATGRLPDEKGEDT